MFYSGFLLRQNVFRAVAVGVLLLTLGCNAEPKATAVPFAGVAETTGDAGFYRSGRASRDGTGKFYMQREIAQVMGHRGAPWLERASRQREERTDLLIARLPLNPNDEVADIGAGTGYFSFPVAARVPEGTVYAVDIQPEMLAIIEDRVGDRSSGGAAEPGSQAVAGTNIETVLGSITAPGLPAESIDLAFIVDAYHEFSHPREMGQALTAALRPGGRLVLVEYRGEDPGVPIKPLHKMTEAQVRLEIEALGLEWESTEDYLPQQHVLTFRKPMG